MFEICSVLSFLGVVRCFEFGCCLCVDRFCLGSSPRIFFRRLLLLHILSCVCQVCFLLGFFGSCCFCVLLLRSFPCWCCPWAHNNFLWYLVLRLLPPWLPRGLPRLSSSATPGSRLQLLSTRSRFCQSHQGFLFCWCWLDLFLGLLLLCFWLPIDLDEVARGDYIPWLPHGSPRLRLTAAPWFSFAVSPVTAGVFFCWCWLNLVLDLCCCLLLCFGLLHMCWCWGLATCPDLGLTDLPIPH